MLVIAIESLAVAAVASSLFAVAAASTVVAAAAASVVAVDTAVADRYYSVTVVVVDVEALSTMSVVMCVVRGLVVVVVADEVAVLVVANSVVTITLPNHSPVSVLEPQHYYSSSYAAVDVGDDVAADHYSTPSFLAASVVAVAPVVVGAAVSSAAVAAEVLEYLQYYVHYSCTLVVDVVAVDEWTHSCSRSRSPSHYNHLIVV